MLYKTGMTTDGQTVLAGVFYLVGSCGVPLEIILGYFKDNNYVVDWPEYTQHALKDGARLHNIQSKIEAAIGEIYGPVYRKEWSRLFELYLTTL